MIYEHLKILNLSGVHRFKKIKFKIIRFKVIQKEKKMNYNQDNCQRRDFCFPHNTKEFCEKPYCLKDLSAPENRKACSRGPSSLCPGPATFYDEALDLCNSKKFLAIKTIRMTILEEFDAFLQQKSKNYKMKFIFLVRDPRGIFNSRLRISKVQYHEKGTEKNIAKKLGAHCQKMSDNIKFIQNSPFWSERTMIVRYEDVAVEPKKFAKKLYGNIGLDYINDIDQWIDDNTHSKGKIFK